MGLIYNRYFKTVGAVWGGCLVVLVLAYVLMIGPQRKLRHQTEKELEEKKQMYHAVIKAAQAENRVKLNEQIEQLRNKVNDFVTDFEDSANLTFDISQIASDQQVDSFRIKSKEKRGHSAGPESEYIRENHLAVSFTAGFNQFATFLNALERHQPVVFVDRFTITRSKQDRSSHKVSMDLAFFVRKRQES
ncbi:MAG: type 4a pilus biogenesis protein PilO [Planctomycetota bacterium]|nr:MAG: type 4a pilus biogenesis protein PilO [Planctomycetota bacterium]